MTPYSLGLSPDEWDCLQIEAECAQHMLGLSHEEALQYAHDHMVMLGQIPHPDSLPAAIRRLCIALGEFYQAVIHAFAQDAKSVLMRFRGKT